MPTTYADADAELLNLADSLKEKYHRELIDADVSITYLFAANEAGDPLKHNGYPAHAIVRLNNLRDRVAGLNDATITVDHAWWKDTTEEERAAVLDHELYHLVVQRDKEGHIVQDDAGRPKLKLKKHDFVVGGFNTIVHRHGMNAVETQAVLNAQAHWTQQGFDFGGKSGDDRHSSPKPKLNIA